MAITEEERRAASTFSFVLVLAAQAGFSADVAPAATACKTAWGDPELWSLLVCVKTRPFFNTLWSFKGWPVRSRWLNAAVRAGDAERVRWLTSACGAELSVELLEVAAECSRDTAVDVMRFLRGVPALGPALAQLETVQSSEDDSHFDQPFEFAEIYGESLLGFDTSGDTAHVPFKARLVERAAFAGNLAMLRYLTKEVGCTLGSRALLRAIDADSVTTLQWLLNSKALTWHVNWNLLMRYGFFESASSLQFDYHGFLFEFIQRQGGLEPSEKEIDTARHYFGGQQFVEEEYNNFYADAEDYDPFQHEDYLDAYDDDDDEENYDGYIPYIT